MTFYPPFGRITCQHASDSTLKQSPLFDVEAFQYSFLDLFTFLHQLRNLTVTLLGLLILARIVWDVDRHHQVGALFLQTQQHEMDVDKFRHFAVGVCVRWRCLDEAECVDWFVAEVLLANERRVSQDGRRNSEHDWSRDRDDLVSSIQDSPQLCHDCATLLEDVCAVFFVDEVGKMVLQGLFIAAFFLVL